MRRIGVFGGTFDPPHIGHLVAAIDVHRALGLDVVRFVVANEPWQKIGGRPLTPAAIRLEMVDAAVAGVPGLEVSAVEIERGGPSFTADTLRGFAEREPDAEQFLVLGADAAAGFDTWERFEEVASLAQLVVVDRPGSVTPVPDRFDWQRVDTPELEISSTEIRHRVATGAPIRFLLPEAAAAVLHHHDLYRVPDDRGAAEHPVAAPPPRPGGATRPPRA